MLDVRRPQCRHNAFRRVLGTRAAAHLVVCDLRRQRARPPPGGRVAHPHGICDLKTQLTSSPFGFHGPRRAETRVDARTDRSERPLPGRRPAASTRGVTSSQTWLRRAHLRGSARPTANRITTLSRSPGSYPGTHGRADRDADRRCASPDPIRYARYPLAGRHRALTLTASRCKLPH